MTVPDYQSLMLPVLELSATGEIRIGDAVDSLAEQLHLAEDERIQLLPSGKQTVFGNRVHWARTYLIKAGLLKSTRRGHFTVTERGQQVIASHPTRIDVKFLDQFPEFRLFKENSANEAAQDAPLATQGAEQIEAALVSRSETPDEIMRVAHKQVEASLGQDLLDRVRAAPPAFFERLIVNLLLGMGYGGTAADAGRALGRGGDDGVDGVIDQDALGLDRVYIQAKRYAEGNNVGSGSIRDFFGSLDRHKATKGLFVTTSTFSAAAKETADFLSKRIVLIDGEHLSKLMIRYNVGCRVEEVLHIKKVDEDFFE
jgi:restriction system protein